MTVLPDEDHPPHESGKPIQAGLPKGHDVFSLGKMGENGVGEWELDALITFHQAGNGGQIVGVERKQAEQPAVEALKRVSERRATIGTVSTKIRSVTRQTPSMGAGLVLRSAGKPFADPRMPSRSVSRRPFSWG